MIRLYSLLFLVVALVAVPTAAQADPPQPDKLIVPRFRFQYYPGSVQGGRLTQDEIDAIAKRTVDELIKRLEERGAFDPPAPPPGMPPQVQQAPAPAPAPPKDLIHLANNCVTCHGGNVIRGGFTLFTPDGKVAPTVDWWKVYDRLTHEDPKLRMPPGKPEVPKDVSSSIRNRARGQR